MSWATILDLSSDSDLDSNSDLVDDTKSNDNMSDEDFRQSNTKGSEDASSPSAVSTNTHENSRTTGSFTHPTPAVKAHSRPFIHTPTQATATCALHELEHIIQPPHKKGDGYKDPWLPVVMKACIEQMLMLLHVFTEDVGLCRGWWIDVSELVAHALGKNHSCAWQLQKWC